jgi:hypothetical protein
MTKVPRSKVGAPGLHPRRANPKCQVELEHRTLGRTRQVEENSKSSFVGRKCSNHETGASSGGEENVTQQNGDQCPVLTDLGPMVIGF